MIFGIMGHPPEEDFVAGAQCAAFEAAFGTTQTPATVKVVLEGIVKCPLYPNAPTNGTYFLPQSFNPCVWQGFGNNMEILWSLLGAGSMQVLDQIFPLGVFFIAVGQTDFYNNSQSCPGPPAGGGTATITWGPEIPKL